MPEQSKRGEGGHSDGANPMKQLVPKMTREIFQRDMNSDVRRLWWRKMAGCDIEKPTNSKAGGYSETWLRVFKTEALPSITATKVRILTETAK